MPEVWQDQQKVTQLSQQRSALEEVVNQLKEVRTHVEELSSLLELVIEEQDQETLEEVIHEVDHLKKHVADLEIKQLFAGKMDSHNAYMDIQSGSGGTEAQDWANMLMRMYLRWCESKDFEARVVSVSHGEVAGIKHATIEVKGHDAYGWLRTETGVHRLVRKSPFNSGNRRHTSFASVFISPEIDNDVEININPADLRIDTYRSSGAGGQHVNTTDSAVRITHLPTNSVVQCQNDRSQHKNKSQAMKQLRAKLYALEMQARNQTQRDREANKADISWGSQIRSYVLDDSRIKDLRTGVETSNTNAVLDGDLDQFVIASLKQQAINKTQGDKQDA